MALDTDDMPWEGSTVSSKRKLNLKITTQKQVKEPYVISGKEVQGMETKMQDEVYGKD